ncbi:hypothetical protein AYO20_05748 [Fonsecaea nubica]|uniref:Heterokaryon incompatibility domain-containing protein n=1 Tax=Fonsecaea nubica TaxID=856822 RepID=A0A178D0X7_9EURO|nr:hypothetical protein AYO20_05748 [Fonsecaea nubica]OAL35033.1 hypothetical protein AYO20_05748 [Fonsecaea nubica]
MRISAAINRPTLLWVDQICIDQSNEIEKSVQVSLISTIYRAAAEVIVWLGGIGYSLFADDFGSTVARIAHARASPTAARIATHLSHGNVAKAYREHQRHQDENGKMRYNDLHRLCALIRSPWFTRVWVLQEVVAARKITAFAGLHVDWYTFSEAAQWIIEGGFYILEHEGGLGHGFQFLHLVQGLRLSNRIPLLYLLLMTRAMKATDPRDKVFATYSLASDCQTLRFRIDYRESLSRVYGGVALAILERDRCLDFLSVPRPICTEQPPLPSWTPDWRQRGGVMVSLALGGSRLASHTGQCLFRASQMTLATPQAYHEDGILRIEGMYFDSISTLWEVYGSNLMDEDIVELANSAHDNEASLLSSVRVFQSWKSSTAGATKLEPSNEDKADIFLNVLSAGGAAKDLKEYRRLERNFRTLSLCHRLTHRFVARLPFRERLLRRILWILHHLAIYAGNWLDCQDFIPTVLVPSVGRRLGRTAKDYLALLSRGAEVDDQIFLVKGSKTPLVLRPVEGTEYWTFVGDCYVHGIMRGEAFEEAECREMHLV